MDRQISSGPKMTLNVTNVEREIAKEIKTESTKILKKIKDSITLITKLRDAVIQQHPSKKDLTTKYKGRLLRYRRKIIKTFNDLLIDIKSMLEKLSELNDPEMIRLREIIVAEIGELSDGAEAIMDLLDDPSSDVFTKTLEQISAQMEKRHRSISDVIDNQLGNHINHDILGKMRISQMLFRIRKRARIVRYLMNIDY